MSKTRTKIEDRPVTARGPVFVARIDGLAMDFIGETKMQAIRKAREFQEIEPAKARRFMGKAAPQENGVEDGE
ncbi:hypothetical protein [Sediminimonas sp.]|uniref:hypothetical protein n=1 Tax=Sediminimonas sp. TaxID=2823379 RepID=UPI0025CB9E8F|nr:hypothetical protein [Sediminimonas sp.]